MLSKFPPFQIKIVEPFYFKCFLFIYLSLDFMGFLAQEGKISQNINLNFSAMINTVFVMIIQTVLINFLPCCGQ